MTMHRYRVRVVSYCVVEARNVTDAKARAELAHRRAIEQSYRTEEGQWGDGWEHYGWEAKKVERLPDDE
jgi:hypothetical protein